MAKPNKVTRNYIRTWIKSGPTQEVKGIPPYCVHYLWAREGGPIKKKDVNATGINLNPKYFDCIGRVNAVCPSLTRCESPAFIVDDLEELGLIELKAVHLYRKKSRYSYGRGPYGGTTSNNFSLDLTWEMDVVAAAKYLAQFDK